MPKKRQELFAYKLSAAGLSPSAVDYVERCNQEEEREATITSRYGPLRLHSQPPP